MALIVITLLRDEVRLGLRHSQECLGPHQALRHSRSRPTPEETSVQDCRAALSLNLKSAPLYPGPSDDHPARGKGLRVAASPGRILLVRGHCDPCPARADAAGREGAGLRQRGPQARV
jgi:hypothetical protein